MTPPSPARWTAIGVLVLASAWPVFVFTGTQASYVVSLAAACAAACALAALRSSLLVGYLAGLAALIGTEVNGQLGNGRAPLGSLRLLDTAMAAAAAVAAWTALRSTDRISVRAWRPGSLAVLSALGVGYATLRWAMEGHPMDNFLRTDLRLIALALLTWIIATTRRRSGAGVILWAIVVVGVLAGIKAAAINASGIYAIGSLDRLQATDLYVNGHARTILIGGDTWLILVPAVTVLLASHERRIPIRLALLLAGVFCAWTLSLSVTRTSVLATFGLVVLAVAAIVILTHRSSARTAIAAGTVLAVVILGVTIAGGTASRLTQSDPAHVGLNFRKDEIKSFLSAPATTKYLGRGLAGRFAGKDVNGKPVPTGWAHELPVWIALKTGIVGLALAVVALAVIARRAIDALMRGADRVQVLAGAVFVLGLVVISLTLDRVALPEGVMPFVLGVYLISSARLQRGSPE